MIQKIFIRVTMVILLLVPAVITLNAQNDILVTLSVLPPYSPHLSDYTDNPGKILIVLQNTTSQNQDIYLEMTLSGDDNDIFIWANQNNPMGMLLSLAPNQVMQVNYQTIQQFNGSNALSYQGITEEQILQMNGLPEGNYTICVRAFSYTNPGTPMSSGESCAHIFIQSVQPPMLISPEDDARIALQGIQNIVFSWTISPGAQPGSLYKLTVIEMVDTMRPREDYFNTGQIPPLFETTINTNTFLYSAAQPMLVAGRKYVWAVTLTSSYSSQSQSGFSGAYFTNSGRSEIRVFTAIPGNQLDPGTAQFDFVVPGDNEDTLTINDTTDLFFNAAWRKTGKIGKSMIDKGLLSSSQLSMMNIHHYNWTFYPLENGYNTPLPLCKIRRKPPSTYGGDSLIPLIGLNFSAKQCDSLEFADRKKYSVRLQAVDNEGNTLREISREFVYKKGSAGPGDIVILKGQLKYRFADYAGSFPVSMTTIKFVKPSTAPRNNLPGNNFNLPTLETAYYTTTDKDGNFKLSVPRASGLTKAGLKMVVMSKYFRQNNKSFFTDSVASEQNLGQIEINVYSYSLKLDVYKVFASEYTPVLNNDQDGAVSGFHFQQTATIDSTIHEAVKEGIPVYLFRKTKAADIPVVEGDMTAAPAAGSGYIKVAMAKTQKETQGGVTRTYVLFRKLICNDKSSPDDTYYIFAGEDPTINTGGGGNQGGSGLYPINFGNYYSMPYTDSSFTAETVPFKYAPLYGKLFNFNDSLTSFNTSGSYRLVSVDPPKSRIKGKIVYQWPSDDNKVVRPLANTPFKVEVEYTINNIPVPTYNTNNMNPDFTQYSSAGFVVEKDGEAQGLATPDSRMVVGTGTTDNDGNFELEVININQKGYIGYGDYHIAHGSSSHVQTPGINLNIQEYIEDYRQLFTDPTMGDPGSYGQNGLLNFGAGFSTQNITNNFGTTQLGSVLGEITQSIKKKTKGPGPFDDDFTEPPLSPGSSYHDSLVASGPIQRVFRIQLQGNAGVYYYNPATDIVCQAFESVTHPSPLIAYVREMEVKASISKGSKENSATLGGGTKTVLFRDPAFKQSGLPAGEGDEKYRMQKLLWPDFGIPTAPGFDKNLEWLADTTSESQQGGNTGSNAPADVARFRKLIFSFDHYSLEACSDPSQGNQYFAPKIKENIGKLNNCGYGAYYDTRLKLNGLPVLETQITLEPLPSRIGARVKNNETDKAMANVMVRVYKKFLGNSIEIASGKTDKDGYIEFHNLVSANQTDYLLTAYYPGYTQLSTVSTGPMDKYGSQFIKNPLVMQPDAVLTGKIVNEAKQGVECYLVRTDSSYVKSTNTGTYSIPMPSGKDTLYVIPLDVGYFRDTLVVTLGKGTTPHPDITVFRRKHRINFVVVEESNTAVKVNGAKLSMNVNLEKTTNAQGEASFEFENISYSNFSVKVTGPKNSDYIPQLINFSNKESETPKTYQIQLKKGGALTGQVKLDGKSIGGARVYLVQEQQSNSFPVNNSNTALSGSSAYSVVNVNNFQNTNWGATQNIVGEVSGSNAQVLQQGMLPLLETYTDKSGNYTLHGIPPSGSAMTFCATLDTTFTVIGDSKESAIQSGQSSKADFAVKRYDYMTIASVFGFPLKIEKLTVTSDENVVKVTGIIDLRYSASPFVFQQGVQLARVRDVNIAGQMVNGKRIGFATEEEVSLEGMSGLKLRYAEKYNVSMTDKKPDETLYNQSSSTSEIKLRKGENGKGFIQGYARIADNSFNYPSSYLKFNNNQSFYLGTIARGKINNLITVITAKFTEEEAVVHQSTNAPATPAAQWNLGSGNTMPAFSGQVNTGGLQSSPGGGSAVTVGALANMLTSMGPFDFLPGKEFNLSNASGDSLRMKLILFNAAANPLKSFVATDGRIHLDVSMSCTIANAKPDKFRVDIPDMVLDNDAIQPGGSDKPLKLKMEDWTLEVHDWILSPVKGGFYSENAMVRTGQVDVPARLFNLRNDMFVMGEFQTQSISLGNGLLFLQDIDPKRVKLQYDYKTGSNMGGHWTLSISGLASNPAARMKGFKQYLDQDELELEYVQLLSNGENILSLKQGKEYKVNQNSLTIFTPTGIASYDNEFAVYGGVKLTAPRVPPFTVTMNFRKSGSGLAATVQPVNMSFEGRGFVNFRSSATLIPKISKDSIILLGKVWEEGALPDINCTFYGYANSGKYEIILKKDDIFNLFEKGSSAKDFKFKVDSGGMFVNNQLNDWTFLTFAGKTLPKDPDKDQIKENRMKFTVYGEIQADGSSISAGDMKAFPGFKLVYKFETQEMIGTMHLSGVEMGVVSINSMDAEMMVSPKGWYLACFGDIMVPPYPIIALKAGIIVGNCPSFSPSLKSLLVQYSPTADPCAFENGISGFYVMAGKPIINKSWDYTYGPIGGALTINVGLEADFLMDFSKGSVYLETGAGIYGLARAEIGSITCTTITGTVDVKGRVTGNIDAGKLKLGGFISTGFSASLKQGIPTLSGCVSEMTLFSACCGSKISVSSSSGFDFSLSGDCSQPDCK